MGGLPMAVLAAKRAGNTGRKVIVATSAESSDDLLSHTLAEHQIPCFRGALHDTLDRVTKALAQWGDETIVFRLTADNVFPDGALLDAIQRDFVEQNLEYLACNGMESGLPYGVSVEVTRLRHLREASRSATTTFDREHVTPYIRRCFGVRHFDAYKSAAMGAYRSTVDCLDDYLLIGDVFRTIDKPVQAPLAALLERLKHLSTSPRPAAPVHRLVMGCAQLGLNYGSVNRTGQPDQAASSSLIKAAIVNGVASLDTARAYGTSEAVIGEVIKDGWQGRVRIVTKLSPLADCPDDASKALVQALVDNSIYQSMNDLRARSLDVVLLHRAEHLRKWHGAAWERLRFHRDAGVIGRLGVSVQNPGELTRALQESDVAHIQLPCNLLDWRWDESHTDIASARRDRALVVHARSPYLQGLLLTQDAAPWVRAHVTHAGPISEWLQQMAHRCGRASIADLCLAYMNAIEWVDGVVVGAERIDQLENNIDLFGNPKLSASEVALVRSTRPRLEEATLDPALWRNERA